MFKSPFICDYILLNTCLLSLPWQGLKAGTKKQKYDKISEKKMLTSIEVIDLFGTEFFFNNHKLLFCWIVIYCCPCFHNLCRPSVNLIHQNSLHTSIIADLCDLKISQTIAI